MAYWLLKTEPEEFSWDDLVKRGKKGEAWTGVRNFTARANLKAMKKDDKAFFYHTGDEKQVVGTATIIKEFYPDPTAKAGEPWVVVDVEADDPFVTPVTLAAVKADNRFADMPLVKYGRLSVQPVTPEQWKAICKMGGAKG
jgi:predicted RNA-binding protein with PUA-like domain